MPPKKDRTGLTRIERRRIEAGLTQIELADMAEISIASLQRLEQLQNQNPSLRQLANLAVALQCEVEDLIEDSWRKFRPRRTAGMKRLTGR